MGMQYDVKAGAVAAAQTDSAVCAGPARVKGIVVSVPAAGGTFTIKNGAGGTTVFTFVAPAIAQAVNIVIPGEGIRCETGIYATTAANMTATVFYG
jgi:hypothetical protein